MIIDNPDSRWSHYDDTATSPLRRKHFQISKVSQKVSNSKFTQYGPDSIVKDGRQPFRSRDRSTLTGVGEWVHIVVYNSKTYVVLDFSNPSWLDSFLTRRYLMLRWDNVCLLQKVKLRVFTVWVVICHSNYPNWWECEQLLWPLSTVKCRVPQGKVCETEGFSFFFLPPSSLDTPF